MKLKKKFGYCLSQNSINMNNKNNNNILKKNKKIFNRNII